MVQMAPGGPAPCNTSTEKEAPHEIFQEALRCGPDRNPISDQPINVSLNLQRLQPRIGGRQFSFKLADAHVLRVRHEHARQLVRV